MTKTQELLDFIYKMQAKICGEAGKVMKKIDQIKQNTKKHSEIVLTLIRVKRQSELGTIPQSLG